MGKTSERTSVTVSLRDLFIYLCSRWRVLVICLLIGAILGGGYSAYKSLKSMHSDDNNSKSVSCYEDLSDSDKAIVRNSVSALVHYMNQFDYCASYEEKSLFQNLDPKTAIVGVLTYIIDSGDENKTAESITRIFETSVINNNFIESISKEFNVTKEEAFYYYDGIVRIGDADNPLESALIIRVYGSEKAFVEKMLKYVKDSVSKIGESLQNDKCEVVLIDETIRSNTGTFIYDRQDDLVNTKKQILKNCTDLINSLEGDVLNETEYQVREKYKGENIGLIFDIPADEKDGEKTFHISKKWIIVGAAGLFVLAAIIIIIRYLLKGVIRCYDDIEYAYGIQVLGTYDDPKTASKEHKFILDRWLKSLRIKRKSQDRESSAALIAKKLQLLAKNQDVKNICVAMGPDVVTDESFMRDVAEKADGLNVTVASNILRNADAISIILEAEGVVLLEQMDRSKFSTIDEERVMCNGNNIKILGVIVAE